MSRHRALTPCLIEPVSIPTFDILFTSYGCGLFFASILFISVEEHYNMEYTTPLIKKGIANSNPCMCIHSYIYINKQREKNGILLFEYLILGSCLFFVQNI